MSGNKLLLDTNVIIGYLKGTGSIVQFLDGQASDSLFASVITRMELLSFPGITPEEEAVINEFLECVTVLPLTEDIEKIAIALRRSVRRKMPDAIVAASAIRIEATLVTCDQELTSTSFPGLLTLNPA